MPSVIRPAGPKDLDAVAAICSACRGLPRWTREHFEAELANDRAYFCVCAEGGEVLGYAGLWILPPEAQITTIAVRPDRVRAGLGRTLLDHLHATAAGKGCSTASLEVSALNEAALALYGKAGYRIVGRRPNYYNDGSDALLMVRRFP